MKPIIIAVPLVAIVVFDFLFNASPDPMFSTLLLVGTGIAALASFWLQLEDEGPEDNKAELFKQNVLVPALILLGTGLVMVFFMKMVGVRLLTILGLFLFLGFELFVINNFRARQ